MAVLPFPSKNPGAVHVMHIAVSVSMGRLHGRSNIQGLHPYFIFKFPVFPVQPQISPLSFPFYVFLVGTLKMPEFPDLW